MTENEKIIAMLQAIGRMLFLIASNNTEFRYGDMSEIFELRKKIDRISDDVSATVV